MDAFKVTKEALAAIRQADASIVYTHDRDSQQDGSYCTGHIKLEKHVTAGQYIASAEVVLDVESRIEDYWGRGTEDRPYKYTDLSGFHSDHCPSSQHGGWHAFVESVKVGDEVSLLWIRDNTSPMMVEHGVTHDQVFLQITRGDREAAYRYGRNLKHLSFMVGYTISETDSWTRLVRTPRELSRMGF